MLFAVSMSGGGMIPDDDVVGNTLNILIITFFSLRIKYSKLSTVPLDGDDYDDDDAYDSLRTGKKPTSEMKTSKTKPKKYDLVDEWEEEEWDEEDDYGGEELERTAFMDKNRFTDVNL